MRKIAALAIAAALAFSLAGCIGGAESTESSTAPSQVGDGGDGASDGIAGSWVLNTEVAGEALTDEQEYLFAQMEQPAGVAYEPVGVIGQDMATGSLYAYLCKAVPDSVQVKPEEDAKSDEKSEEGEEAEPPAEWDVVVVSVDQGEYVTFVSAKQLDPSDVKVAGAVDDTDDQAEAENPDGMMEGVDDYYAYGNTDDGMYVEDPYAEGTGEMEYEPVSSWGTPITYECATLPKDADKAYKSAMFRASEGESGYLLSAEALLATQVQTDGKNYQVLCVGTPVDPVDAPFAVYNVVVHEDSSGGVQMTSMDLVDLDYYVTE